MDEVTRCIRCVMDDSSDGKIKFDANGYCNYCSNAFARKADYYFPNEIGEKKLNDLLKKIKEEGKNREYDCLMGISGGLDSSYLLYLGYKWGLRILCVHIDDSFDSDISKKNIEKLMRATGYTFVSVIPDEKQYFGLLKAYMRASVPNLDTPQDSVLFATLYRYIEEKGIKYFLSGGNYALECILQSGHSSKDLTNLKDINRKYGEQPLNNLCLISNNGKKRIEKKIGVETVMPLNFINYNRDMALKELSDFCEFEYYGRKHLENKFTAFVQLYWLPNRFRIDKRTSHLSSMIVSGQLTRDEALEILDEPLYNANEMDKIIDEIKIKLEISDEEYDSIMTSMTRKHTDFKTSKLVKALYWKSRLMNIPRKVTRLFKNRYK